MSNELEADLLIGEDMKAFLNSDVGKYILGCAEQDIQEYRESLQELDPYKYTTLADLQNAIADISRKAEIAGLVKGYIADAIIRGQQAEHTLNEE